jgi:AcrR family transcriptional regulator
MRVRTDAKRQEIVDVAAELFLERGYQGTSMSLVSQRLGGSKATLYGYFKSKEDLLFAVLEEEVARAAEEVLSEEPGDDIREFLRRTGLRYLRERLSPRHSRLFRIVASLPEENGIGRQFHQGAIVPSTQRLADLIAKLIREGVLRSGNPWTMAIHFKGMLDQDFVERSLLSPRDEVARGEIEQAAWEAAEAFMRAYGVSETTNSP